MSETTNDSNTASSSAPGALAGSDASAAAPAPIVPSGDASVLTATPGASPPPIVVQTPTPPPGDTSAPTPPPAPSAPSSPAVEPTPSALPPDASPMPTPLSGDAQSAGPSTASPGIALDDEHIDILNSIPAPPEGWPARMLDQLKHVHAWVTAEIAKVEGWAKNEVEKLREDAKVTVADAKAMFADNPGLSSVHTVSGILTRDGNFVA